MNIIIRNSAGKIFFRPDTTCDRPGEDLYPQEFIQSLSFAPVAFVRVCKAGRSVSERFASRYYDAAGFGLFLYPDDLMDGSAESIAEASCIDHTSFLPAPTANPGDFSLLMDGKQIFSSSSLPCLELEKAIAAASARMHIRTGDIIALELCRPEHLCSRPCRHSIEAFMSSERIIDFNIVMNIL